jgi:hypothetical protein
MKSFPRTTAFPIVLCIAACSWAANYYVATTGNDTASGTLVSPFRTIQKAANVMQPGDTCFVRSGTYREWVKPPRGGNSEAQRIVYQSFPGDSAVIKGSEQVSVWVKSGPVWRAELPNSLFGTYNPYKITFYGQSLAYGQKFHLGNVYCDGVPYAEKLTLGEVDTMPLTWFTQAGTATTTVIYANFGTVDPTKELAEINVRECVFYPVVKGLKFITVDGFTLAQSSENWSGMTGPEKGLIGMYAGLSWIIQNCTISDAKCTGINCGNDTVPSSDIDSGFDITKVGHHIVRNNSIRRCGENGIMGYKGWAASIIENNLVEEINYLRTEYGGFETAGIKAHLGIDLIIRNNVIRKVYKGSSGDYDGLWLDWGWQGCRISGNIIYDLEANPLNLMFSHGPTLVDNNIFLGHPLESTSENVVFAHNLFDSCTMISRPFNAGPPPYWLPHTATFVKVSALSFQNNKYYNNIFTVNGMSQVNSSPGFQSNWNAFYHGAQKSSWGDAQSLVDGSIAGVTLTSLDNGVAISFTANSVLSTIPCPVVTRDLVGIFSPLSEGIENPDGSPCSVNQDILGKARSATRPTAGPFESPATGTTTFTMIVGPKSPTPVSVSKYLDSRRSLENLIKVVTIVRPDSYVISVRTPQKYFARIINSAGAVFCTFHGDGNAGFRVPRESLRPGLYFLAVETQAGKSMARAFVINE